MIPENGLELMAQDKGDEKFEERERLLSEVTPELGEKNDPLERIAYVLSCLKSAENLTGK